MVLKAVVVTPNEKTAEVGSVLAISRAEACRREQVQVNPPVRALVFVAELGVYVAVYEVLVNGKSVTGKDAIEKIDAQKVDCRKSRQKVS
jgi:hypothetical protein